MSHKTSHSTFLYKLRAFRCLTAKESKCVVMKLLSNRRPTSYNCPQKVAANVPGKALKNVNPQRSERERKRRFEKQYVEELRKKSKQPVVINLLLVGTSNAGKTTLLNHMRMAACIGFTMDERKAAIPVIIMNLIMDMNKMFRVRAETNIPYRDPASESNEAFIRSLASDYSFERANQIRTFIALRELWADDTIKYCISLPKQINLAHSLKYFLSIVNQLSHDYYLPSNSDMLMNHDCSVGYKEVSFNYSPGLFKVIDAGGLREQRRLWTTMMTEVTSALFVFSMADYDITKGEGFDNNNIEDSLNLLRVLRSSSFFRHSAFIVFLSKRDLLEQKIQHRDLARFYPDFRGPRKDPNAAQQYFLEMVSDVLENDDTPYYTHVSGMNNVPPLDVLFQQIWDSHVHMELRRRDL